MTEKESAHLSALPEYQTDREDCVSNDLAKVMRLVSYIRNLTSVYLGISE